MLVAAYREAFRVRDIDLDISGLGTFTPEIYKAISRLNWLELRSNENEALAAIEGNFRSRLVEFDALAERRNTEVFSLRNSMEDLDLRLNKMSGKIEDAAAQFKNVNDRIASTEAAFFERIGTKETKGLWQHEAAKAAWSFYLSGGILLAVLLSIPLLIIYYQSELLILLQSIEQGAVRLAGDDRPVTAAALVIGRLLLLTIPVGSIIWAVKLIVRFNVRSMLLMDDANQRVTMLNTYLFLVQQQAASPQDRGALLEAMFRRAPGHGPETIEPPSMVEILNYGKEVGKPAGG